MSFPFTFSMSLSKSESDKHFKKVGVGKERKVSCQYCHTIMTSHDTKRWASHFLDPKTKAGEGFVDEDLYDNAELLR